MQTVAETPTFSRHADKLFREEEKRELIDCLAMNPLAADEIPGGGVMSTFGKELIESLGEALAHAQGGGPGIVHTPVTPREVRLQAKLTQAQMAPLMGMSLSGYRKWEQGARHVSGPAETLLRVIQKEPEAVRRALLSG